MSGIRTPRLAICLSLALCLSSSCPRAQQRDTIEAEGRLVTLSEVVVRSGTDVAGFIRRVRSDTTFYKAFRNLRVLNYESLNDIRMLDRKGALSASLRSRTRQSAWTGCRVTRTLEQTSTGDFFDRRGDYNYFTARLYDGLFFSFDTVCGQHNRVAEARLSLAGKSGLEKRKEQLKMLFFDPGGDIPGIPLLGEKARIFDPGQARLYDFDIDIRERRGRPCYVFSIQRKEGLGIFERDRAIFDEMVTWFDYATFEVMQRSYSMRYDAGVYAFDVRMDVEMAKAGTYLYPAVIRYDGAWNVALKGREKGLFTATVYGVSSD
jgi:hypothetical protein